ncbi:hypothetical protein COOONC_25335 [Cooperia oncophora]
MNVDFTCVPGKQSAAAQTWEDILKDHPTDLIAIKFAHDTYFYLGDSKNIRDSIKAVMPKHKGTEPCYSFLHGMLAFGLEECEQYAEAEKEALKGLELNRFDCWSTHARAHIIEMQGRFDEGIAFMESTEEDWKRGWMLAAHNYWHATHALYYAEKDILSTHSENFMTGKSYHVQRKAVPCWILWMRHRCYGVLNSKVSQWEIDGAISRTSRPISMTMRFSSTIFIWPLCYEKLALDSKNKNNACIRPYWISQSRFWNIYYVELNDPLL